GDTLMVTNSTFSGNSSLQGGAIVGGGANGGTLTVINSTFSDNRASQAGAILTFAVTMVNSILAHSTGGNCLSGGTITDGGHNIDDGTPCAFNCAPPTGTPFSNTDPLRDPP